MTIFAQIHHDLHIPDDYYRTDLYSSQNIGQRQYERQPPAISEGDRHSALAKLHDAGIIDGPSTDDLLKAIVIRMRPLVGIPLRSPGEPKIDLPPSPYRQNASAKKQEILAGIVADPKAKTVDLAERLNCSLKTIQNYRAMLRREGRI